MENDVLCLLPDHRIIPLSKVTPKCCPIAVQLNKGVFMATFPPKNYRSRNVEFKEMQKLAFYELSKHHFGWRLPTEDDIKPLLDEDNLKLFQKKLMKANGNRIKKCIWLNETSENCRARRSFDLQFHSLYWDNDGSSWELRLVIDVIK